MDRFYDYGHELPVKDCYTGIKDTELPQNPTISTNSYIDRMFAEYNEKINKYSVEKGNERDKPLKQISQICYVFKNK